MPRYEELESLLAGIEPEAQANQDANEIKCWLRERLPLWEVQVKARLIRIKQELGVPRATMEPIWTVVGIPYTESVV